MKERITPCKHYICEGECSKGREATHKNYCQHCKLYEARARIKHINLKKQKLDKIKKSDFE